MMAFISIEDLYGTAEIVVFPKVYERASQLTEIDRVVQIKGTLNFKEDEAPKILAEDIQELRPDSESAAEQKVEQKAEQKTEQKQEPEHIIKIRIPRDMDDKITMDMVQTALKRHRGEQRIRVYIYLPSGKAMKADMMLDPSGSLKNQLIGLIGYDNVKM